ncbi:hypothetical protein [Flectobacillus rivi]|uniref:Uncharacterized protein n=1 Tax=Flectobacillus rivi TaxID=2984209 RepID=A0ABT6Z1I4_9BACT|nr:hypothetical protein [Flectobacillus rivi]MDI9874949.1 hypothetical protein [Flectobacillus rivi]
MVTTIVQHLIRLLINSDVSSKLSKNTISILKAISFGLTVWMLYKQFYQKKSSF